MRNPGYYWVLHSNRWNIAEWTGEYWLIVGESKKLFDINFQEISETMITKEEYELQMAGYKMLNAFEKAAKAYEQFIKFKKR